MTHTTRLNHLLITTGAPEEVVASVIGDIESDKRGLCIPLNLSKYVLAKDDLRLAEAVKRASLVIADGLPITWMARRCGVRGVHRFTGIDLAEAILQACSIRKWPIYLLGARQPALEQTRLALEQRFPGLVIAGSRNGYFTTEDEPEIVADVNQSGARVLLLGMGLPQKEYFALNTVGHINANFTMAVGGAFDVWSGNKRRAPRMIQAAGLEWLYRSFYDISRASLIARYGIRFMLDLYRGPISA